MHSVRICEIPHCKMVSSGVGMFGEESFEKFDQWFSSLPRSIFPKDFLFWDNSNPEKAGFHWLYLYEEGMIVPDCFDIIDFQGGLYAVATDIDQQTDTAAMKTEVDTFLSANGLERDSSRPDLGNIISSPLVHNILGYDQMDYYIPVKIKG
ncbi:MAG: GyrI-like domain-containing protein [Ruminococcaceae bacterium]|nr:GyrI-like domain-containing protein [Oscillospiraceae bacterium]